MLPALRTNVHNLFPHRLNPFQAPVNSLFPWNEPGSLRQGGFEVLTNHARRRYFMRRRSSFPGCVMVAQQTLDLLVGVRILPGENQFEPRIRRQVFRKCLQDAYGKIFNLVCRTPKARFSSQTKILHVKEMALAERVISFTRPLRLSVRTKDSQSLKRGSTPLGARSRSGKTGFFIPSILPVPGIPTLPRRPPALLASPGCTDTHVPAAPSSCRGRGS